jgi:hypothetical protein
MLKASFLLHLVGLLGFGFGFFSPFSIEKSEFPLGMGY